MHGKGMQSERENGKKRDTTNHVAWQHILGWPSTVQVSLRQTPLSVIGQTGIDHLGSEWTIHFHKTFIAGILKHAINQGCKLSGEPTRVPGASVLGLIRPKPEGCSLTGSAGVNWLGYDIDLDVVETDSDFVPNSEGINYDKVIWPSGKTSEFYSRSTSEFYSSTFEFHCNVWDGPIEHFHVTSLPPCWRAKTIHFLPIYFSLFQPSNMAAVETLYTTNCANWAAQLCLHARYLSEWRVMLQN